jgi:hypothetical protein
MKEFYIDCDGMKMHAKLDRPEGADKGPLCILFHGFTGHMEETHIVGVQKAMNEAGVSVLRVELYGHGGSDGEFKNHTLFKWVTQALAVVHYAKALDFVTDLYLCGHSMGGLLTMLIAPMCPDDIKGIIPLSPAWIIPDDARKGNILGTSFDPAHIPDVINNEEWELSGDFIRVAQTINVEAAILKYKGTVLLIHGDEDDLVSYDNSLKAEALYKNARLVTINEDDHIYSWHLEKVQEAIKDFFKGELEK